MKKCAVIIGVNKTGNLPQLSEAVNSAQRFEEWAKKQNFDTSLHIDETNPVISRDIFNAVLGFVKEQSYDLMIIYFSGHGILRAVGDEKWLLSEAPINPNEAINVLSSKMLARMAKIPHVVFISDACRSLPNHHQIASVSGSEIFPISINTHYMAQVDMFYATSPFSSAFEVKSSPDASTYNAIYTDCLLDALEGKVPNILLPLYKQTKPKTYVIPAHYLGEYLRKTVPKKLRKTNLSLSQYPDSEITSQYPKQYLAEFDKAPSIIPQENYLLAESLEPHRSPTKGRFTIFSALKKAIHFSKNNHIDLKSYYSQIQSSLHKNTSPKAAFVVTGVEHMDLIVPDSIIIQQEKQNGAIYLLTEALVETTLLVILENGHGIPLTIIPKFTGILTLKNNQVLNIDYIPSLPKLENHSYQQRSLMSTGTIIGINPLAQIPIKDTLASLNYFFTKKRKIDPILELQLITAYFQIGNLSAIDQLILNLNKSSNPLLLDSYILLQLSGYEELLNQRKVYSFCPLMAQTWSYLNISQLTHKTTLQGLAQHLVPSLWTTFTPQGVALLKPIIKT